jgi:SM-20-related protein
MIDDEDVRRLGSAGFFTQDGFLATELVSGLRQEAAALGAAGRFRQASVGQGGNRVLAQDVRSDETLWLEPTSEGALGALYRQFEVLGRELSESAYLGLGDFEVQLARYAPGAAYARHRDAFAGDSARRATAIVYLNPGWGPADGGELRLHVEPEPHDIAPRSGRLIVFLSDRVEHEVLPARAPRYAATAWFRGRAR